VGVGLGALLLGGILISALVGQLPVTPAEVVGSLLRAAGIPNGWAPGDSIVESTLWVVRFPRQSRRHAWARRGSTSQS